MTKPVNEPEADLVGAGPAPGEDPAAARKKAMDLLARREYGHAELVGRLRAAGFSEEVSGSAVQALAADGLQDDARFASNFLRAKAGRGSGPLRIRQALREKGLGDPAINAAFADDDTDWFEQARLARCKKFGEGRPRDFREKARQMRFLQYRGFDYDQIEAAVDG